MSMGTGGAPFFIKPSARGRWSLVEGYIDLRNCFKKYIFAVPIGKGVAKGEGQGGGQGSTCKVGGSQ